MHTTTDSSRRRLVTFTRTLSPLALLAVFLLTAAWPSTGDAVVSGVAHSRFRTFQVFGDAVSVGNTLMGNTASQPNVNSFLLADSRGTVQNIPANSTIEGAYLFWSGSVQDRPDRDARIVLLDGVQRTVAADTCFTSPVFGGFFYCRADVTDLYAQHPRAPGNYNGVINVGDVTAKPGLLDENGECIEPNLCQAFYAAWSVVVVYSNPTERTLRDVTLFDGFRQFDEDFTSGIGTFVIDGFEVANPPQGQFSYFAMEGDELLGVPPQNMDSAPDVRCNDCFDFLEFNGTHLIDERGWENNLFNSSTSLGVDLDSFDVSEMVDAGDSSVTITVGSGDGIPSGQGGGGESFFLGYVLLRLNRLAPSFRSDNTFKSVDPAEAGPGETVFFSITVTNDGSLDATNTVLRDVLDGNLQYVAGSTRLDGVPVMDGPGGEPPFAAGLSLGRVPFSGDNDRRVTFRATVRPGTVGGTIIRNSATIAARELPEATPTNEVTILVTAPTLGTPTKAFQDTNGGVIEPGDLITYTIFIPNQSGRTASGVGFVDDMPTFVHLRSVASNPYDNRSDPNGGINGTGRIDIRDIVIPANQPGVFLSYTVQIDSAEELIAAGVAPEAIDGLTIVNQGRVSAAFLPAQLLTDDPTTPPTPDPTVFRLTSSVNFRNASTFKRVVDVNGGALVPGDRLRYTISLRNSGNRAAAINLVDDLPPSVQDFTLETPLPQANFTAPPAGANNTGRFTVTNLDVAPRTTVELRFTVVVAADAPNGTRITNTAALTVPAATSQNQSLTSETLTVTSGPSFEQATKEVLNPPPGGFQPGDTVSYRITLTNSGNRAATAVRLDDDIALDLTNVRPADGGALDAAQRRVRWNLGDIAAGETRQLNFTADIVQPLDNGTRIRNQGVVFATNLAGGTPTDDPTTPTPDDFTIITVRSVPSFVGSTKTVQDLNGGDFEPGDLVRYTLTVDNTGRETARSIAVSDPIDTDLLVIDSVGNGGQFGGGVIQWNPATTPALGQLAPDGAPVALTFTARIISPLPNGTEIANQGFVVSQQTPEPVGTDDPLTPEVGDPSSIFIRATPNLSATTKQVVDENQGTAQPGDLLTWTINVVNDGNGPARGVRISDPIDANLTNVVASDGGVFDAASRTLTWSLAGPVPPGESTSVQFRATIAPAATNGTIIRNQATVTTVDLPDPVRTDDPATPAIDDPTVLTVRAQPDFVLSSKFVRNEVNPDGGFRPDDIVSYVITVRNTGSQRATNVLVSDTIPAGLVAIQPLDGGTLAGRTVSWRLPSMDAGAEATVNVRATIANPIDDGTLISNQAFITSTEITAPVPTDNPNTEAEDDATDFVVSSRPIFLGSRKTFVDTTGPADGPVKPGHVLTWTLDVINSGTSAARNVLISDPIDPNLVDVNPGTGLFDAATRTITWGPAQVARLATLAPDAPLTLTYTTTVRSPLDNGTLISNQASIVSDELDEAELSDDPRTAAFPDATQLQVVSAADFTAATKVVAPAPAGVYRPGDEVEYTISFTNNGDAVATNVVVTDVLDANLIFSAATNGGTFSAPTVTWNRRTTPALASVAPGQNVVLRLTGVLGAPIADGTVVFNQARIAADGFVNPVVTDDPATAEVDDPTLFTVTSAPVLTGTTKAVRDLDDDGFFEPGDVVEYAITVRNDGDDDARNVVLTDVVDTASLEEVTALDGGRLQGNTVTWNTAGLARLGQVRPGDAGRVVVRFRATIRRTVTNRTAIANQARVGADGVAPVPTDDPNTAAVDDATTFIVVAEPRFSGITKRVEDLNGGQVEAGDRLRYTITVPNDGTELGRGVQLVDPIDPNLVDIRPANGGALVGQAVQWGIGELPAGESRTVTFEAAVRGGVDNGTVIVNQAGLTATGVSQTLSDDPTTPAEDDATVVVVNAEPDLTGFAKSVVDLDGDGFYRPGDEVEFTLAVTNSGTGTARNVIVRDPIDTALLEDLRPGQNGTLRAGIATWSPAEVAELSAIPINATIRFTLRARLRQGLPNGTVVLNQANVVADGVNEELSDDLATAALNDPVRIVLQYPEFARFDKTVRDVNGGLTESGDLLEYTLEVQSGLGAALTNVTVVDPIEANLTDLQPVGGTFDAATRTVRFDGRTAPQLGTIATGATARVSFTARVLDNLEPGTVIENQAVVSSPQLAGMERLSDDPRTPAAADPTAITVQTPALPNLDETTKTVIDDNGGLVEPGDTLTWAVRVINTGRVTATGVGLLDPTPNLTTFVPGSIRVDGTRVDDAGELLIRRPLPLPVLDVGESTTVTFQVQVSEAAPIGGIVANQGIVLADGDIQAVTDDPATRNVDDPTQVVVGAGPNITGMTMIATPIDQNGNGRVDVGEQLEVEIRIPNRGNQPTEAAILSDVLPASVTYMPGTLTANGAPLTDDADTDAGNIDGREVRILLGAVNPGDAPIIRFHVRVEAGPLVVNQGQLDGRNFASERTDADGNDANGDQPTLTPVGSNAAGIEIGKAVKDVNGGYVEVGDEVLYTLTVRNLGDQLLEGLSVTDELAAELALVDFSLVPEGAVANTGRTLFVRDLRLPPGATRTIAFRARINDGAAVGTSVCNQARAGGSDDVVSVQSDRVCFVVGGLIGAGLVQGRLFQDIDRNGRYGADNGDLAIGGFLIRAVRSGTDRVVSETVSAADGTWALPSMLPGKVDLRWYSRPPGGELVRFGEAKGLAVDDAGVLQRDLLIDPSGRIYNSRSGELIGGVEVFLYYADEEPDRSLAGKLVAPADLPEGQQGQLTVEGLYRFDVRPGHLYRLAVVAPNQALSFPSIVTPPQPDFWNTNDDPLLVVDNALPSLTGPRTWFLKFNITADLPPEGVQNNHIPLDSLSGLIQVDKFANKRNATVGEIVTYTVRVANRSTRDLIYDTEAGLGGIYVRDVLPRGFNFVKGSARLRRITAGEPVASFEIERDGELASTFGLVDEGDTHTGPRPVDLLAGDVLELRYQLLVGIDTQPGQEYVNRANVVLADGSVPVSNDALARVRVVYDPIFDQGVVIGKVFCDDNGDGWQDSGEKGIFRARLYLDNGWFAVTDKDGKYHFQQVDPGNHLIKIDTNTLPAGGALTTDERRVFYTTRGLPSKVNFGASCPVNIVADVDINESKAVAEERERLRREKFVQVDGDAARFNVSLEADPLDMPQAALWLSTDKPTDDPGDKPVQLVIRKGALDATLVLNPRVDSSLVFDGWTARIWRADASDKVAGSVRVFTGKGAVPPSISWDGKDASAKALVLVGPAGYLAEVTVHSVRGATAISPPVAFAVSVVGDAQLAEELYRGPLFDPKKPILVRDLELGLGKLAPALSKPGVKVTVAVHTADDGPAAKRKALSQSQAAAVKAFLVTQLKVPAANIEATGFGDERPLVPNFGRREREINRRVEVKVTDPNPEAGVIAVPEITAPTPEVWINNQKLEFGADNTFSTLVRKPEDGVLVIEMNGPLGTSIRRVSVKGELRTISTPQVELPVVPVKGDLKTGALTIGTRSVNLAMLGVRLEATAPAFEVERGVLRPPAAFKTTVPADLAGAGYRFEISDSDGRVLHTEDKLDAVPAQLRWAGTADGDSNLLTPGLYRAQLTLVTKDGQVGASAIVPFQVTVKPEPPKGRKKPKPAPPVVLPTLTVAPSALVGGQRATLTGDTFAVEVQATTGQRVVVDLTRADGSRAVELIEVPAGFERPAALQPEIETHDGWIKPATNAPPANGATPAPAPADATPDAAAPAPAPADGAAPAPTDTVPAPVDGAAPAPTDTAPAPADGAAPTAPEGHLLTPPPVDLEAYNPRLVPYGADSPVSWEAVKAREQASRARRPSFRLLLAQDTEAAATDATVKAGDGPAKAPSGALSDFGAEALDAALASDEDAERLALLRKTRAANLKVQLPPQGTVLNSRELVVSGDTDPANVIRVNGQVTDNVEGHFAQPVMLPLGESELVIESTDPDNNSGVIRWPVKVKESGLFLMAFADTAVGAEGVELDGLTDANSTRTGGALLVGQAKVYLKGYMSGRQLLDNFFQEYKATAFFDSARQAEFEEFLTDTVKDDQYYPIYGDSSELVNDVNARGKLYVLLEADESSLAFGNRRADLQGIEFFRYDRPFYGAQLDFNKVVAEHYKTELKAFVSDDDLEVSHTYDFLAGTGGSLYYLRRRDVIEGSEKVTIVVRDEASGIELARIPQSRNVDYTIDYGTGRILFKAPIPSVMAGGFLATRVSTTQQVLDGNPVLIEASYDYEATTDRTGTTWGTQLRETFFDALTLGGGFVEEGRNGDGRPAYRLGSVEVGARYTDQTKLEFEYAQSQSFDTNSFYSSDGGLTFDTFSRRSGTYADGEAYVVRGNAELGDFVYDERPQAFLSTRGYFQHTTPGFFANGLILEQGQDKFGGELAWKATDANTVRFRHDGIFTTADDLQSPNPDATKLIERQVSTLQHVYRDDAISFTTEYSRTFYDDDTVEDGFTTHVVGERVGYRFAKSLEAFVGQQVVVDGDPRIYNDTADKLQTDLGVTWNVTDAWQVEAVESLRWNGENATQLGLGTKLDDGTEVYVKERLLTREDNDGLGTTTIVGGQQRFADGSGRLYSEYHVDSGIIGERSRAVVGIGKGFKILDGLSLDLGYEHSQTNASSLVGDQSRDVGSVGWEYLMPRRLKFTQKFEIRYDDAEANFPQANPCFGDGIYANPDFCRDNFAGGQDKVQFVTSNNFVLTFLDDHSLLARFEFSTTENLTFNIEEQRHTLGSFGYALRPVDWDYVNILVKYTTIEDLQPVNLVNFHEERELSHVVSFIPIFELPFQLQLVEKLAFKRTTVRYDDLPQATSDTWLWINRLNYHLTSTFDAGLEYRFLTNSLSNDVKHGALVELSYILAEYARLGVGYNFTSFSDDELTDLNRDAGGFFLRVQGTY